MSTDLEWEEYKLLQNKIDNVGSFRFQVKGWAVTLLVGFLLGGLASDLPSYYFLLGLLVVFGFHILELYQVTWQKSYVSRLAVLEYQIRKRAGGSGGNPGFPAPGIVRVSAQAKRRGTRNLLGRVVLAAHNWFYGILYLIILLFFVIRVLTP